MSVGDHREIAGSTSSGSALAPSTAVEPPRTPASKFESPPTWEIGVGRNCTVSASWRNSPFIDSAKAWSPRWVQTTPLGLPVVPDV